MRFSFVFRLFVFFPARLNTLKSNPPKQQQHMMMMMMMLLLLLVLVVHENVSPPCVVLGVNECRETVTGRETNRKNR